MAGRGGHPAASASGRRRASWPPHVAAMPFALRVDSPVKNYDSGGMSVEGAKPAARSPRRDPVRRIGAERHPHGRSRDRCSASSRAIDPRWAVVEYNSADLSKPKALPTYADAYRGLRDMWNYGARFVSPMAWPGSDGRNAGKPGYDPFTAWRNTPLEEAATRLPARARATCPRERSCGRSARRDMRTTTDGPPSAAGSRPRPAGLALDAGCRTGATVLVSPAELRLDGARALARRADRRRVHRVALRVEGRTDARRAVAPAAQAQACGRGLRRRAAGRSSIADRIGFAARDAAALCARDRPTADSAQRSGVGAREVEMRGARA